MQLVKYNVSELQKVSEHATPSTIKYGRTALHQYI